jgi:hypothetical protein
VRPPVFSLSRALSVSLGRDACRRAAPSRLKGRAETVGTARRRSRRGGQPTCRHLLPRATSSQVARARHGLRLGTPWNAANAGRRLIAVGARGCRGSCSADEPAVGRIARFSGAWSLAGSRRTAILAALPTAPPCLPPPLRDRGDVRCVPPTDGPVLTVLGTGCVGCQRPWRDKILVSLGKMLGAGCWGSKMLGVKRDDRGKRWPRHSDHARHIGRRDRLDCGSGARRCILKANVDEPQP